jgi:hypothetical protein
MDDLIIDLILIFESNTDKDEPLRFAFHTSIFPRRFCRLPAAAEAG